MRVFGPGGSLTSLTTYAKPEDGIKILPSEGKEGDLAASIALGKMRLDQ